MMLHRTKNRRGRTAHIIFSGLLGLTGACSLLVDTSVPDKGAGGGTTSFGGGSGATSHFGGRAGAGEAGDRAAMAGDAGASGAGGGGASGDGSAGEGASTGGAPGGGTAQSGGAANAGSSGVGGAGTSGALAGGALGAGGKTSAAGGTNSTGGGSTSGGSGAASGGAPSNGGSVASSGGSPPTDCTPGTATMAHVESLCVSMDPPDPTVVCVSNLNCPSAGVLMSKQIKIGGAADRMYDVALSIRGIVETNTYDNSTSTDVPSLLQGGTPMDDGYTVGELLVTSPQNGSQGYFVNSGSAPASMTKLDYSHVFRVAGQTTFDLRIRSSDCKQHTNCNCLGGDDGGSYDCANSPLSACNEQLVQDSKIGDRQYLDMSITSCKLR